MQASSLLAVLAGYAVLLLANRELAAAARSDRHRQAIELVRQELLLPGAASPAGFQAVLDRMVTPGRLVWLELVSGVPYRLPRADGGIELPQPLPRLLEAARPHCSGEDPIGSFQLGGRSYLCSSHTLPFTGRPARLQVLEDVSADRDRERTSQLLLLVAAGLSSLFTSALLRLVLRRGLRPLDQLSRRVAVLDAERLGGERLPLVGQPQELQPIVRSFNGLLDRLAAGRERQQAFVDGVAHELRTPITLISGYAQRLRRQRPADGELERISTEASRMGRLVADLLDIARDEAGRLEVRREQIDLDEALLVAFERLEPLCGGRLLLHPPGEGAVLLVSGDRERLQQCLTNLVENALKYAPGGPLELFGSATAHEVIAHVRDHGPGVAAAEQERIFERFVRGTAAAGPGGGISGGIYSSGSSGGSSGSGIGLSMVRLLMERMAGRVEVAAAPGGGAEFRLVLPLAREGEENAGTKAPVPAAAAQGWADVNVQAMESPRAG